MKKIITAMLILASCARYNPTGGMLLSIINQLPTDTSVTQPVPVVPVNTTRKTFMTTLIATGNITGVAGADAMCMADVQAGTSTYKAMIVDGINRNASVTPNAGDGQIDWVFKPNYTYYRIDGTTEVFIADTNGIFVFGTLTNSFTGIAIRYWTGLKIDWTLNVGSTCDNNGTAWGDASGGANKGADAVGNATNVSAIDFGGVNSCNSVTRHIMCIEQ